MGRAVRRVLDGRRDQPMGLVMMERNAAVRAVAGPVVLGLLALAALSSLGGAQASRRDSSRWTGLPQVIARTASDTTGRVAADTVLRAARDTSGDRRGVTPSAAPRPSIDASGIAAAVGAMADSVARSAPPIPHFRSARDSIMSERMRLAADRDERLRIVIALNDRMLWALLGPDTLLRAPVAVSTDETLEYAGKRWTFETPRGLRSVIAKRENPVWIPPDWHYAEVAREHGLKLEAMVPGKPTVLSDGSRLEVRNGEVGIVHAETGEFQFLRTDEEIIFDGTLFIPPTGSVNRRIEGELGDHMLDTGNGFLLHGTPHKASIGTAATHGCIRLRDEDIRWLYDMIPVGTRVYIY